MTPLERQGDISLFRREHFLPGKEQRGTRSQPAPGYMAETSLVWMQNPLGLQRMNLNPQCQMPAVGPGEQQREACRSQALRPTDWRS